jgi:polysaccharide export outer membrane protein
MDMASRLPVIFSMILGLASLASRGQGLPERTGSKEAAADSSGSLYVLGPDDVISLRVADGPDLSEKPVRVDAEGYIRLPLLERVKAGGLTVEQLVARLAEALRPFLHNPDVSVSILEYRSQPVSVIGYIKSPGVHQLQGRKTLVEVLALAGGLTDDAGYTIKVTREIQRAGRIQLPSAADDDFKRFSVAQIDISSLLGATHPEQNIIVLPHDVISVPRGQLIYVTGEVGRSGGFVLKEMESMSVLQALSLAGGVGPNASAQNSRILRANGESSRIEIRVDLKRIWAGKSADLSLKPDDILFVPTSASKKVAVRSIEAAIQMATGVVIWRR